MNERMYQLTENEKKLWEKMFFLWKRLNVPAVRTKEFIVGRHKVRSPWFSLREREQVSFNKKSINKTAKHLILDLAGKEDEVIAAFKMYSFFKTHYGIPTPFSHIFTMVMETNGIYSNSFWFSSSKGVLPYIDDNNPYQYEDEIEKKDWISVVLAAADTWIKIAEQWEIFTIPEFTERDSDLNKKLEMFTDLWHNDEDFQKFIRLRDKFEKNLEKDFYQMLIKEKE